MTDGGTHGSIGQSKRDAPGIWCQSHDKADSTAYGCKDNT